MIKSTSLDLPHISSVSALFCSSYLCLCAMSVQRHGAGSHVVRLAHVWILWNLSVSLWILAACACACVCVWAWEALWLWCEGDMIILSDRFRNKLVLSPRTTVWWFEWHARTPLHAVLFCCHIPDLLIDSGVSDQSVCLCLNTFLFSNCRTTLVFNELM